MKKTLLVLIALLLCSSVLVGCSCQHEWLEATCTTPKTCSACGETEGEVVAHTWSDATCVAPKTCTTCGAADGEALAHTWSDATCAAPKTCTTCGAAEGEALAHTWAGTATYQTPDTCTVCGTEGEPLTSYFAANSLSANVETDTEYNYVTCGYTDETVETIGKFTATNYRIFASDDKHKAKDGFEYRAMDITIDFTGEDVYNYGTLTVCTRADYYTDTTLAEAGDKKETFTVNHQGTEYSDCTAVFENAGFSYEESIDGMRFHAECVFQVPTGYDGVVLAFYNGTIDIDGMHLHEVEDANMLLVRLA